MTKYTVPLSLSAMAERGLELQASYIYINNNNDYYMIATL